MRAVTSHTEPEKKIMCKCLFIDDGMRTYEDKIVEKDTKISEERNLICHKITGRVSLLLQKF